MKPVIPFFVCLVLLFFGLSFYTQAQNLESARLAFERRNFDKAKEIIDEVVSEEQHRNDPQAWLYHGQIYAELAGDIRGAFLNLDTLALYKSYESYKKAQKFDTRGGRFYQRAKVCLDSLYQTAINFAGKYYKQAYRLIPADKIKNSLISRDTIERAKNLYAFVLNAAELAQVLGPKDTLAYNFAAFSALAADKYDAYLKASQKLIELITDPEAKKSHYESLISNCINELKDQKKAVEILDKAIEEYPDDKDFQDLRLTLNFENSNEEEAVKNVMEKIEDNPKEPVNYYNLGIIYQKFGKMDLAIKYYKKCLELDPSNYDAVFNVAGLLYNKAVSTLQSIDSLNLSDYTKRGKQLENIAKEEFKIALPYFELARQMRPRSLEVLAALYQIYTSMIMEDKAAEVRDLIISIKPDYLNNLYKNKIGQKIEIEEEESKEKGENEN